MRTSSKPARVKRADIQMSAARMSSLSRWGARCPRTKLCPAFISNRKVTRTNTAAAVLTSELFLRKSRKAPCLLVLRRSLRKCRSKVRLSKQNNAGDGPRQAVVHKRSRPGPSPASCWLANQAAGSRGLFDRAQPGAGAVYRSRNIALRSITASWWARSSCRCPSWLSPSSWALPSFRWLPSPACRRFP
jgi:hypothetical protein